MQKIQYKTDQNNPTIKEYKEAVEKGKKDQHVLPRENGWVVKSLLSENDGSVYDTQAEAIRHAESVARALGTAVFVHSSDGRIRDKRNY